MPAAAEEGPGTKAICLDGMSYLEHPNRSRSQAQLQRHQLSGLPGPSKSYPARHVPRQGCVCVSVCAWVGVVVAVFVGRPAQEGSGGRSTTLSAWGRREAARTAPRGESAPPVCRARLLKGYIYPLFLLTLETVQSY